MPEMLPIIYYPDPILRKATEPIEEIDDEVREMVESMALTMAEARGLGLAANQVGWNKRLALVSESGLVDDYRVVINPEVLSQEGAIAEEEGCLSFPGLLGLITRPERITIRYMNLEGEFIEEEAEELLARCFMHEIDHLDGILFISKMTPADRLRLKKSIKELEEQYAAREPRRQASR